MYDTIVVPVDGSEHAVRAAEHARRFASLFDAAVHVVHVVDVQGAAGMFDAGGVDPDFVAGLEGKGEEAIEAVVDAFEGVDVRTALVEGRPSEAILEYATEHGADLLTMGTHGREGLDHFVTGSVTERVVRLADVPVVTIRATDGNRIDEAYEEILVPTDGSAPAEAAARHAIAVAERTDARVHAVHVVDIRAVAAVAADGLPAEMMDSLKTTGEQATEAVAERARSAGLDVTTSVREGVPARDILTYAEEHGVDLIAMGTAGRSGIERILLGSTTSRIIRRAEVPVLATGEE